ncbi:hypothetical protein ON010_g2179 [Phytophthora cinnamomi]|nr:hypothetical protein ON010_g2179 [Phytophthora cinnamomi]
MARSTPSTRSSLSSARSGPTSSSLRPEEASEERRNARRGFLQLQELECLRASKRARHHFDPLPDSDEDEDADHAILDNFQALGADSVLKLCNFTVAEISRLWSRVSGYMATRWNVGKGNKHRESGIDVLFISLCVLKNGGRWDLLASTFNMKAPTFEKKVVHFLDILSPFLFKIYVDHAERDRTMRREVLEGHAFQHYPEARYAVGVTFQQANMPGGTQQERASYYSKKHKLHGYKTEVSVLPTGLAINCSRHYKGSEADITIFRKNKAFHVAAATKPATDDSMADDGPLRETYPDSWMILADKGYQGLASEMRVLIPKRSRPAVPLTVEEEAVNHDISSDRVVVENYFGRLCTLWSLCSDKYRWQEVKYEVFFRACVALTNVHVRDHPLRAEDGEHYRDYLRSLNSIGTERRARRLEANRRSRRRRQLRLETAEAVVDSDVSSDQSTAY